MRLPTAAVMDEEIVDATVPGVRAAPPESNPPGMENARVTALDWWLTRRLLRAAGNPPVRVALWDGRGVDTIPANAVATLEIRDRRTLLKIFAEPDLGFGDAYGDGRVRIRGNLVAFLEAVYRANPSWKDQFLPNLFRKFRRPHVNTPTGSRGNIHHHYDLGNDFYRLWLDDAMVYTCAYYLTPNAMLEEAQTAKMDHVCRKLRLRRGQTVIEAGCGWGALARHMARHYGVRVRAFNISREQLAYARALAQDEGVAQQIEYIEDDYRNIKGTCDAFVSVGMLEHVGPDHYRQLGAVIRRCLKPEGLGLLHSIGRNWAAPMNPWMERRIFPGSYLPTLREMMEVFEPFDLSVLDVENLRLHYAKTLAHWLERFEQHAAEVEKMYDARFVRTWRLYLAGSLAGFTTGRIQLFQVVFAPAANNAIPWTRADLYPGGRP